MAEEDLRKWTSFFNVAGVPGGPSAEYATLFCNHRIKENLLGDLTKDILNDIGITVMGDIMSILRHAKAVYAKLEREKLSNRVSASMMGGAGQSSQLNQQIKKKITATNVNNGKTPAPRPAEISVKPNIQISKKVSVHNDTTKKETSSILPKKRPVKQTLSLSERFSDEKSAPAAKQPRNSTQTPETDVNTKTKKSLVNEKARKRVQDPPAKRQSAFERLGKQSGVSEVKSNLPPKVKLTKSPTKSSSTVLPPLNKSDNSVFDRLGGGEPSGSKLTTMKITTRVGSRVISGDNDGYTKPAVLRPIKPTSAVKPVKPVSPVNTIIKTSSNNDNKTKLEKEKKSVFLRLGSPT